MSGSQDWHRFAPIYRVIRAFSAEKSAQFLSIAAQLVYFRVNSRFLAGHIVSVSCVFMHIAGSIFIFNISKGRPVVSDPEKHIREPPQLGASGNLPSSA